MTTYSEAWEQSVLQKCDVVKEVCHPTATYFSGCSYDDLCSELYIQEYLQRKLTADIAQTSSALLKTYLTQTVWKLAHLGYIMPVWEDLRDVSVAGTDRLMERGIAYLVSTDYADPTPTPTLSEDIATDRKKVEQQLAKYRKSVVAYLKSEGVEHADGIEVACSHMLLYSRRLAMLNKMRA